MVGRPGFGVGVRRAFWQQLGSAGSIRRAAAAVGVSATTGQAWIAEHVQMRSEQKAGLRLSAAERDEIALRTKEEWTATRIAKSLGRATSTITREWARNKCPDGQYRAGAAEVATKARAARPKPTKLAGCARLAGEVEARLKKGHSPQQITARLKVDFVDDESMQISHETIYQELYVHTRGTLKQDLARCLRTGRVRRRPHRRAASTRPGPITDMVMIADRPAEIAQRIVPGHWEGDLICGAANKTAIGTLVELTTSLTLLVPLVDGHTAAQVQEGLQQAFAQLPAQLRRSLTWDQGGEMARHQVLTAATGTQVYFCDPHSPWQRPSNENTNGLLRQYFPKGTDLSVHTAEHLATVQAELNDRPRQRLGWRTPAEAFAQLLSNPTTTSGVAMTS